MSTKYYSNLETPLGPLLLLGDGNVLTGLYMDQQKYRPSTSAEWQRDDTLFYGAREQLHAYFAGELQTFNLPIAGVGTSFQQTVWQALLQIPFGATETYGGLARRIGRANASRAVGLANGRNPIGIIVPCHRVIGASGGLTGYAGGVDKKRWLLSHEQRYASR